MKLFKYKDFIKESKEDIDSICKKYNITNYTINEDGSINVSGDVDISLKGLAKLPLKFKDVSGHFCCSGNMLTSLEGCPESMGGNFSCGSNLLTSLEGCPQSIEGYFNCYDNQLTSLEGCPRSVGGGFYCRNNKITNFKGFPEYYIQLFPEYCKGHFSFLGNPVNEILLLFNEHPKSIDWINEHEVIQGDKVILRRLEEVAYELKMELPEKIKLKNYEII